MLPKYIYHLVLFSDWPNPVLSEVEDDPVGLPRERGRLGLAGSAVVLESRAATRKQIMIAD